MKTTLLEVDNGIFEPLRLRLVADGYLPNILDYIGDTAGYELAKQAIRDLKKPVIEIENSSNYDSRNTLKDSVILINRMQPEPADTGVGQDWDYNWNATDEKYDKVLSPTTRYDISYQITYLTVLEETASIVEHILLSVFSNRKYLSALKSTDSSVVSEFMFHRLNGFDTSGPDFLERGARYVAKFVDLEGDTALGQIAPFDFAQFVLDMEPLRREVLLKQLIEIYDVDGVTITGYEDLYKLGLVVTINLAGEKIVTGPNSELYKINADDTITYLNPDL